MACSRTSIPNGQKPGAGDDEAAACALRRPGPGTCELGRESRCGPRGTVSGAQMQAVVAFDEQAATSMVLDLLACLQKELCQDPRVAWRSQPDLYWGGARGPCRYARAGRQASNWSARAMMVRLPRVAAS